MLRVGRLLVLGLISSSSVFSRCFREGFLRDVVRLRGLGLMDRCAMAWWMELVGVMWPPELLCPLEPLWPDDVP